MSRLSLVRSAPVCVLALLVGACASSSSEADNDAGPSPSGSTVSAVLELEFGSDSESFDSCPPVTAQRLARQDFAFSGVLDAKALDRLDWVLTVDRWFSDGEAKSVAIRGSDPVTSYFGQTVGSARGGARYLIAGKDGAASACLSMPWTKQNVATYRKAFAG